MSQSFELRIIEDGTHSSDHSCLIGLRFWQTDTRNTCSTKPTS